jgi:hypothetical protein
MLWKEVSMKKAHSVKKRWRRFTRKRVRMVDDAPNRIKVEESAHDASQRDRIKRFE